MIGTLLQELSAESGDLAHLLRVALRLLLAGTFGGLVGFEREYAAKTAGLRTHMLVALGAALFVVIPSEAGMNLSDLGRVIQGVAAGIGFVGGGAILKAQSGYEVRGLTTAATIWLTAAVGVAAGLGQLGAAAVGTALTLIVLVVIRRLETRLARRHLFD